MDGMSLRQGGHQREVKVKKRAIHLYARKDNKLAILPRSTFRGEEMRGREEKSKKRVIHLYAGKDNKLAILTRSTFRGEEMKG